MRLKIFIHYCFTLALFSLFVVSTAEAFSTAAADQAFHSRKYDQALTQYQTLLTQNVSPEKKLDLNFKIAECHYYLGHKEEAIDNYRQAYENTQDAFLKRSAGYKLVMIQTADRQYENSFAIAREMVHQNSSDNLTTKVIGYGAYSAFKVSQTRSLSISEKADALLMYDQFKVQYPALFHKNFYKDIPKAKVGNEK